MPVPAGPATSVFGRNGACAASPNPGVRAVVSTGGPTGCLWSANNVGPNDEIFSFHTGGAQAVFADGAVRFLSENMDSAVIAKLVARADGEQVDLPSTN